MYLLLDIGGTKTRISFSESGLSVHSPQIIPTNLDFDLAMEEIGKISRALTNGQKITAVVAGVRALNPSKEWLINHPIFPLWVEKPLKQELEKMFDCPVFLENDASLVGLGEAIHGAGKGKNIVAFLTLSTGIGGTKIIDGKIDPNFLGFEPGHQIIYSQESFNQALKARYLEEYIGGTAIAKMAGAKPEEILDPQVWDRYERVLAVGLNNTIVYWSPQVIVLGGSVSQKISLEKVEAYLRKIYHLGNTLPEIKKAELAESAGLIGGLEYLKTKLT